MGNSCRPTFFQLVPDFSFGYQSEDQLAFLNNGSIVRQQSHRDLLEWGFGYPDRPAVGNPGRLPRSFLISALARRHFEDADCVQDSNRGGLGDVSLTLQKQVLHEKGWIPDLLVNLNYTAATGGPVCRSGSYPPFRSRWVQVAASTRSAQA